MGVSERPDIDVHSLPTIPFRNKQETVTAVGLNFVQYNNPKPVFLRSDFFVSFLMSLFLRRKFVRWHLFVSFLLLIFDFIGTMVLCYFRPGGTIPILNQHELELSTASNNHERCCNCYQEC